jgi:hypothetical protein
VGSNPTPSVGAEQVNNFACVVIRVAEALVELILFARLAQLVEHLVDVERVIGSSPIPRTKFDMVDERTP